MFNFLRKFFTKEVEPVMKLSDKDWDTLETFFKPNPSCLSQNFSRLKYRKKFYELKKKNETNNK